MNVTRSTVGTFYRDITTDVCIIDDTACDHLLLLARGKSSKTDYDEWYDILTDETVEIEEDENGATDPSDDDLAYNLAVYQKTA